MAAPFEATIARNFALSLANSTFNIQHSPEGTMDNQVSQLSEDIETMWAMAKEMGLDPYPIHFELVPATIMYEFGAYGLPGRYSHWTHGKAYYRMKTQYDYGL